MSKIPLLAMISGNSLAFSRKRITSTGFYRCCAPGASAPVVVKNQSPRYGVSVAGRDVLKAKIRCNLCGERFGVDHSQGACMGHAVGAVAAEELCSAGPSIRRTEEGCGGLQLERCLIRLTF